VHSRTLAINSVIATATVHGVTRCGRARVSGVNDVVATFDFILSIIVFITVEFLLTSRAVFLWSSIDDVIARASY